MDLSLRYAVRRSTDKMTLKPSVLFSELVIRYRRVWIGLTHLLWLITQGKSHLA